MSKTVDRKAAEKIRIAINRTDYEAAEIGPGWGLHYNDDGSLWGSTVCGLACYVLALQKDGVPIYAYPDEHPLKRGEPVIDVGIIAGQLGVPHRWTYGFANGWDAAFHGDPIWSLRKGDTHKSYLRGFGQGYKLALESGAGRN